MRQPLDPMVFIVVLNWHGWRDTIECLESLQQLEYENFRLIVVDNGSRDDSWERIKGWARGEEPVESRHVTYRRDNKPLKVVSYSREEAEAGGTAAGEAALSDVSSGCGLVLVQSGRNLGFAGGYNIGLRYGLKRGAEYFWLLNNDTVVGSKALAAMVRVANSDGRIGLVGSVLRYYQDPETIQAFGGGTINWWWGTSRHLVEPGERLDFLTGASLLVRRSVVESAGLLDEAYFFYWEDIAYSQRALRAGWKIIVAESSRVLHKEGGTVSEGERAASLASDCLMVSSTIRFFSDYGGVRWPLAVLLRLAGIVINRLRRGQKDRILPILKVAGSTCWKVCGVGKIVEGFRRSPGVRGE